MALATSARAATAALALTSLVIPFTAAPAIAEPAASPDPLPVSGPAPWDCTGVKMTPGSDLQAAIRAHPEGTTFCLEAGMYRLASPLLPKARDSLIGQPGTVLNGSKLLSDYSRDGANWVASGQTQQNNKLRGECYPRSYTGCRRPESIFIDDQAMWQVMSLAELSSGEFYFDYANDKVYLADDPTGHKVEASIAEAAVTGGGLSSPRVGVTLRNLTVEKFSNTGGAITTAPGWIVANNEVRLNFGCGITAWGDTLVTGNRVREQGRIGVMARGTGAVFDGNEIDHNNTEGHWFFWEAGGSKFWGTHDLTVRNNYVHDNYAMGLWSDGENRGALFENNIVEDNMAMGILYEKSLDGVIRNNIIRRNGLGDLHKQDGRVAWDADGAGIRLLNSGNVEVYGNTLEGNKSAVMVTQLKPQIGGFPVANVSVHDNTVGLQQGRMGLIQLAFDDSYFTSRNNHFEDNNYCLGGNTHPFAWMERNKTSQEWKAYGNDDTGTFSSDC